MTLPGECVNETQAACMKCGTDLTIQVLSNAAGFYIDFFCPECGPYSRESGYFHCRGEVETALNLGDFGRI